MADEQEVPLMLFITEQCRKFSLFPNERTTLISQADEMQIVQYCLACYNKMVFPWNLSKVLLAYKLFYSDVHVLLCKSFCFR